MPVPTHPAQSLEPIYARIAQRPRLLIAGAATLAAGLALAVTVGKPLSTVTPAPTPAPAAVRAGVAAELDPLALLGAYNAASMAAAAAGDASLVLPFFTPDSREPDAIRAEFARRAALGELHEPSLVRWGTAEQQVHPTSATIVTQEVWDDQVYRHGVRVDSRRGTTLRIRYALSRANSEAPWRIVSIDSYKVLP